MSDFDFLKKFAHKLNREELYEPVEEDWLKVATELDRKEQKKMRNRAIRIWVFPVAALLLFLWLGAVLMQTKARADAMQIAINSLQNQLNLKQPTIVSDTSEQYISIIHYDTIYKTVFIQRTISDSRQINPGFDGGASLSTAAKSSLQIIKPVQYEIIQSPAGDESNMQDSARIPVSSDINRQSTVGKNIENDSKNGRFDLAPDQNLHQNAPYFDTSNLLNLVTPLSIKPIKILQSNVRSKLPAAFELAISMRAAEPPPVSIIHKFRPNNFILCGTGGILFPQSPEAGPNNGSYIFGLNAQVGFDRHFRAIAGYDYSLTNFKVEAAAIDAFNIPPLNPPTSNDILDYVLVKQPLLNFSLGLNYMINPEKRFRPFIGLSWTGEKTREQTLKYEFKNQLTEEETYILIPGNNSMRFNASGLKAGLGLECAVNQRFMLEIEGVFQRQFNAAAPFLSQRWGLKAGLAYHF